MSQSRRRDTGGSPGSREAERRPVMAVKTWTQKAATRATASGSTGITGAGPAPADGGAARRWWVLAVASVAQLMVVLDVTVVNIALPSAQRALAFSDADRQWVVTAYSLAFGSLLLIGGKLSDLLGRNRTFMAGLAGFAAASALAGAAGNFAVLAAGRAAQGAFGALLAPSALAIVTATFAGSPARGRAFAIFGAVAGIAGAIGPAARRPADRVPKLALDAVCQPGLCRPRAGRGGGVPAPRG